MARHWNRLQLEIFYYITTMKKFHRYNIPELQVNSVLSILKKGTLTLFIQVLNLLKEDVKWEEEKERRDEEETRIEQMKHRMDLLDEIDEEDGRDEEETPFEHLMRRVDQLAAIERAENEIEEEEEKKKRKKERERKNESERIAV